MERLRIFKIGGHVINEPDLLDLFLQDLSRIPGKKIIVHGGGKIASEISVKLGIEPKMVNGRRVTDTATMHVVTMVYAGLVNKIIVSKLNGLKLKSAGFSGTDAHLYTGSKRQVKEIDYGLVADLDPSNVNVDLLTMLLEDDVIPVLAPVTADEYGTLLNVNADTVSATIASALSSRYNTELIMCFEKQGVMNDPDEPESVIREIYSSAIDNLINEKVITGGMIPKIENARSALYRGVSKVVICNSSDICYIDSTERSTGTTIYV